MSTWHISYSRDVLFSGCNYNCTTPLPSSNYVTLLPIWKIDEDIPISNVKADSCVDADYKGSLLCSNFIVLVMIHTILSINPSRVQSAALPCRSSTKSRISTFSCHVLIFSRCFIHLPFFIIYLVTVLSAEISCSFIKLVTRCRPWCSLRQQQVPPLRPSRKRSWWHLGTSL